MLRYTPRALALRVGALTFAVSLGFGAPVSTSAQELVVTRPVDVRPEQRIDVNGSLISVTYVENAEQADAVFFRGERERYQRAGSDPMGRPYGLFLTADMIGRSSYIVLDLSWLKEEDNQRYVNLMHFEPNTSAVRNVPGTHESVQLLLQPLEDGTYRAREYREIAKGSEVNNTDWGINEAYTTRDDSIDARVDNVPDDDEALNQGDRFDNKGRRVEDDDD
jgi:hypothetical protein